MGIIARYFSRLKSIIHPKNTAPPTILINAAGLRIGDEWVAWNAVCRVDAYKRDIYVADFLAVVILSADGRVLDINEESPGWQEAGQAIERFLPGSLPHAEWQLRLMAATPGETVAIFPVTRTS